MPIRKRFAHGARALLTAPIIVAEWDAIRGRTPSTRAGATRFLNDISNSTHGRGLEFANQLIGILRRNETRQFDRARENESTNSSSQHGGKVDRVVQELREVGRSRVDAFIPRHVAESIASDIRNMPGRCDLDPRSYPSLFDWRANSAAEPRFHTSRSSLQAHDQIIDLTRSRFVLEVAREYLGVSPLLASLQSWTTRPPARTDPNVLDAAAMAYHCDSDFFGFLKFFVLLTEVRPENGPFTFVERSHRGIRHVAGRMPDTEIVGLSDIEFLGVGLPGDLLIVDTKGWHKATPPIVGERTMLQFVFASSLFGAPT